MSRIFGMILLMGAVAGCTVEAGSDENVDETQQQVFSAWNDGGVGGITVGMAIFGANTYQWRTDGTVCRGPSSNPCSGTSFAYSAGGAALSSIMGIGIAKNTSNTFAWYSDSTVSQGHSDNLTAVNGKVAFTRPAKPGGGLFAMSQLLEVDNSDSGTWYYYWLDSGTVYRTTGTSVNGGSGSGATPVTVSAGTIRGIAFDSSIPARVYTFYSGGSLNVSTSSLNLAQP